MDLENAIKDVISQKMKDGTVEKLVAEKLEEGIKSALDSLFRGYGDATKVIENKIKEVIVPVLEGYDYSEYIVKLDYVLTDILKATALDNKKILENFKDLMTDKALPKTIKVSDMFEVYKEYVVKNVSTSDLEVCYEDDVSYENVEISVEFEENESRGWSDFKKASLIFECEQDEDMNFEIPLSKWKDRNWSIDAKISSDVSSLRHLNEFNVYILKLIQNYTDVEIDTECENDDVEPEQKPEADFR